MRLLNTLFRRSILGVCANEIYKLKKENKNMDNRLEDVIAFLQGEVDQLLEFKEDEDKLAEYIERNDLSEDYNLGNYLEDTWILIYDQVEHRRGYEKEFANYILDIIDAYYAGGNAYVENDIEAQYALFIEALEYIIAKLNRT